jgi:hypothetical protein
VVEKKHLQLSFLFGLGFRDLSNARPVGEGYGPDENEIGFWLGNHENKMKLPFSIRTAPSALYYILLRINYLLNY